jgi:hypothetical protein
MGRSPDRLTPAQKDAIYDLKHQGKSGAEVKRIVSMGYGGSDPFRVSVAHVNETYRLMAEDKGELFASQIHGLSTDGALDRLQARLLRLAEREIARLERQQRAGKLDGSKVARMATALERIHKLSAARTVPAPPAPAKREGKEDAKAVPSTFAEQLAEGDEAVPAADVVLTEGRGVPGPKPKRNPLEDYLRAPVRDDAEHRAQRPPSTNT